MEMFSKAIGAVFITMTIAVVVGALTALPVMWLWNACMPELFGLTEIGFWNALWFAMLVKLLIPTSSNNDD